MKLRTLLFCTLLTVLSLQQAMAAQIQRDEVHSMAAEDGDNEAENMTSDDDVAGSQLWTNGRVPYEFSDDFSDSEKQSIREAFDEFERYTCIQFVPATESDVNRLKFQNSGKCVSYVGMRGGVQDLHLGPRCFIRGILIHEIGHAVGFRHVESRPDRDNYVTIAAENIRDFSLNSFRKLSSQQFQTYGVPYDYTSVMHSGQYDLTKGIQPSLYTLDSRYQTVIGNQDGLSYFDIMLANKMYRCEEKSSCEPKQCPEGTFQGKDCNCWCNSGDRTNPVQECNGLTTTTTAPVTEAPGPCVDELNIKHCQLYKEIGYCQQYTAFMAKNCRSSCNIC